MKQSINFYDFCDAFRDHDRQDQFSYEGKNILFNWIEQYEDDCGTEIDLDVIGLCCEFSEESAEEIAKIYSLDTTDLDEEEVEQLVKDHLEYNTLICGYTDHTIVYASF